MLLKYMFQVKTAFDKYDLINVTSAFLLTHKYTSK